MKKINRLIKSKTILLAFSFLFWFFFLQFHSPVSPFTISYAFAATSPILTASQELGVSQSGLDNTWSKYTTFVPSSSGSVQTIQIKAGNYGGAGRAITCKITDSTGTITLSPVLNTESFSSPDGTLWRTVNFSASTINLTASTTYRLYCKGPDSWLSVYWVYDYATNKPTYRVYVSPPTDTTPPTIPTNLTATAVSSTQINLAWTASTDSVGVTGYRIYRSGTQIGTSTTTSYSNGSLTPATTYTYTVAAYDAVGNLSSQSISRSATTLPVPVDTTPPTIPTNLTATTVSSTQINLAWSASTDSVGVAGYRI